MWRLQASSLFDTHNSDNHSASPVTGIAVSWSTCQLTMVGVRWGRCGRRGEGWEVDGEVGGVGVIYIYITLYL